MSDGSSKNYIASHFPSKRGVGALLILAIFSATGCLGQDDGNPKCDPVPFTKTITPIKVQGHEVYFDIDDFDFLFQSNMVVSDISFQGVAEGRHRDDDRKDDFNFDVNGSKTSRCDGDRNVHWNCGNAFGDASHTPFCSPMEKFSLNGGLSILDFMLRIKLQRGALRLSAHGPIDPNISNVTIVATGTEHPKTCTKPPPVDPPPAVAPVTKISAYDPTDSPTNVTTKSITFAADQTGVQYTCSLDGAAMTACSSPKLYSGLASGAHTFKVSAKNAAGLSDANPPVLSWVVDTQPPTVTITNGSTLPVLTNTTSIAIQFTSNEASTFTCQLDSADAQACTSPFSANGLSEGTHKVTISAIDGVGNASAFPATYQWSVDLTAPLTTINQVTPASSINNATETSLQFSANETADFACSIDNGAYAACQSPYVMSQVTEGSHWFNVRATDVAGNQGATVSYSWKTDFTAPVVSITSATPPAGNTSAHNIALDFALSEPASVTCSFDGAEAAACTSPFTTAVTAEGTHSLVIAATDAAGNASAPTTLTWSMDFTSPRLSLGTILPTAAASKNSTSVSLEILSSESVTMTASVNGSDIGAITSPLVLNNLTEGVYNIVISAHDSVGNLADQLTYSFYVDLTAPNINLQTEISGLTNLDRNTLTFSADESADFACDIDEAGFGACLSPLALSGLADGVHVVKVHATDLAGNVSAESTATWTVDTTAPVTTLTTTQNAPNQFTFNIAANEDGSSFQCSLDGATAAACTSPVTIANLTSGAHTFSAQAIDVAGNVDPSGANAAFTVNPPSTTLSADQTSANSITFTFASNSNPATFVCSLDGGGAQVCTSPKTVSGVSAGTHTLLVRAVDGGGNMDPVGASAGWTVTAPSTTLSADQNANSAITFTFTSNVADATFFCSRDGATATLCVSPYAMSGLTVGNHTFLVQAKDSAGNIDPTGADYSWTVRPPVTTTMTAVTPSSPFTNQGNISFSFSSNHSDATFVCSLNGAAATPCTSPAAYTGLTDGAKSFKVQAVDIWGTVDATGATFAWTIDTTAPGLISVTSSSTSTSITVNWTTNEPATTKMLWGKSPDTTNVYPEDTSAVTSHSVHITGLTPNTLYTFRPAGTDRAGNAFLGGTFSVRTGR